MQHTATNGLQWSVCVSISVLVTAVSLAAMTEPIKMPLVGVNSSGPKEPCNVCPDLPRGGANLEISPLLKSTGTFYCTVHSKWINHSSVTAWQHNCCCLLQCSQLASVTLNSPPWKKSTLLCNLVSLTSDIWKVSIDERLCLCVDSLDTSADDGNVRLNDAVFLQQILHAHQVLAILLRLQVHLPTTHTHAMTDYVKIRHAKRTLWASSSMQNMTLIDEGGWTQEPQISKFCQNCCISTAFSPVKASRINWYIQNLAHK